MVSDLTDIATPLGSAFFGRWTGGGCSPPNLKAGPESGTNGDYVIRLHEALRKAGISYSHVAGIATEVQRVIWAILKGETVKGETVGLG